jgi:hypothetical protein
MFTAALTAVPPITIRKRLATMVHVLTQFTVALTAVPPITIHKPPATMGHVLTQPVEDVCVLGKKIPTEMEAKTAAAAGVTLLLVPVPMGKAAATFLTKNTVT